MTRIQAPLETKFRAAPDGENGLQRRDWIAGLEKGLAILETFGDAQPRMTAAQMGEQVGMTRTAARRYLLTLRDRKSVV